MSISREILFRPFVSEKLSLPNRIVMAPMTRSRADNGIPGADIAEYYRRRACNEVGFIITEGVVVEDPATSLGERIPNFFGAAIAGWKKVAEAVHAEGGKIAPQLWHLGMARNAASKVPNPNVASVGPSGLTTQGDQRSEPMTQQKINRVIAAFAQGAADAKHAGFDAVQIHGAHGYLIDQFLWEKTNRRTDGYGGSLEKRLRFAIEIIEAVRAAVGPEFPVLFRFSQWKEGFYDAKLAHSPAELEQFLLPLQRAGVDIFDASTRRFWEPEFAGSDLNIAGWTRKITGLPTISVGSVGLQGAFSGVKREQSGRRGIDDLLERMARDEFDLIAIGRALLADAQWARKVREHRDDELSDFSPDVYATLN